MNSPSFIPAVAALLLSVVAPAQAAATTAEATPGPVFNSLDTDHDGQLSPQEFRAGYAALQQAMKLELRLREQFRSVDVDRSGAIEAGEYGNLVLVKQAGAAAPALATFDADRNGSLAFVEYVAVVRALAAKAAPAPAGGAAS